mmetsp:Transcript_13172/g.25137  ORF Transcript_13172/g.25137 Transcript_13172/m.25137 type:complete len:530 (+) Transcript_13172:209-1798(+)|eukprot:CAMPEP_0114253962 /NCGR_PEP_ID=MMETSP0058-20121206/16707_1 /TAXON_ID=36894 /ORGANISM="Pyramimonas parkeae, CCMP726" /LENGTH=529 /DNA_ID=CAMNT_0001368113 /DNA_START=206 /DNA_END=1795 /DNA_ORIENTATION=+
MSSSHDEKTGSFKEALHADKATAHTRTERHDTKTSDRGTKRRREENDSSENFISTRRPKDAVAGFSSGAQTAIKGCALGAAALVTAPLIGAKEDGVSGFFTGLTTGLVSAVLLPALGCSVGAVQLARGVLNTPKSISEAASGKRWDMCKREWVVDNLAVESTALNDLGDEEMFAGARTREKAERWHPAKHLSYVSNTEYYEEIQVPPTATHAEIQRSYYILACQWHPDKSPGDKETLEKFEALGKAYQVLSRTDSRLQYDQKGKDSRRKAIDAAAFFAAMFVSDRFSYLVGRPLRATKALAGAKLTPEELNELQQRREKRLAAILATRLQSYLDGGEEVFAKAMKVYAEKLAKASYGVVMLHTVGIAYSSASDRFLGSLSNLEFATLPQLFNANVAALQDAGRSIKTRAKLMPSHVARSFREIEAGLGHDAGDGEGKNTSSEEINSGNHAAIVGTAWSTTVMDIESTLVGVCQRVLYDHSVSKSQSIMRASGLKRLGTIFQEVKGSGVHSPVEATMMRAMGADLNYLYS